MKKTKDYSAEPASFRFHQIQQDSRGLSFMLALTKLHITPGSLPVLTCVAFGVHFIYFPQICYPKGVLDVQYTNL